MKANTDDSLAELRAATPFFGLAEETKHAYLRAVSLQADPSRDWAEFGVQTGGSARVLLEQLPADRSFYLFDSFRGLPEEWSKGDPTDPDIQYEANVLGGLSHPAGSFSTPEKPAFYDPRVVMVEGWFADTLPGWAAEYTGQHLGLIHIDCDLYSSAKTVYENVGHLIRSGTIILFDELTKNHDRKAFQEFLQSTGNDFEYLAAVRGMLHVAVRIL